jgi:hypothetical protein
MTHVSRLDVILNFVYFLSQCIKTSTSLTCEHLEKLYIRTGVMRKN